MRYLSVCSGIEAATVAWHPLGWVPAAFAEIEKFPRAVLAHHYPTIPNYGNIAKFKEWPDADVDVLVGGTPCQSFSVAGLRKGLDDPRGNLALVFLAIADRYRPRWVLWENVPGVLSSDGGRDFGSFLRAQAELGYGFAYRVLDAQYFGVPQRRRRVFVVGHLGDWRRAAAVLFERESMSGSPAPSREARGRIALPVTTRIDRGGEHREAHGNNLIPDVAFALSTKWHSEPENGRDNVVIAPSITSNGDGHSGFRDDAGLIAHSLKGEGHDASEDGTGRGVPLTTCYDDPRRFDARGIHGGGDHGNLHPPVNAVVPPQQIITIDMRQASRGEKMTNNRAEGSSGGAPGTGIGEAGDPSPTIATDHIPAVAFDEYNASVSDSAATMAGGGRSNRIGATMTGMAVRRLTPKECARLQGFPDDYLSQVPGVSDSAQYRALGNSMAVPVMRWLGERIAMADAKPGDMRASA